MELLTDVTTYERFTEDEKNKIEMPAKKWIQIVTALTVSIVFIALLVNLFTKQSPITYSPNTTKNVLRNFCDQFSGNTKTICTMSEEKCKIMPSELGMWSCMSIELVWSDEKAAQEACKQLKNLDDQKFCFADTLKEINFDVGIEQCDLINSTNQKIFCNANILKQVNLTEALSMCEKLEDNDSIYSCKALVTSPHDKDLAKTYCGKITDIDQSERCVLSIKY